MRLLLVRHGQTESNVLGLLDTTVPGPGLTDLGRKQAAALPGTLVGHRIDAVYASTQHRAQLTAEPVAITRGLPVTVRAGLREVDAGELEMLGDAVSTRTYQRTIRQWMSGYVDVAMPGGPSGADVLARFDAVVSEVADSLLRDAGDDGCALLVSHGAVLRLWATVRAADLMAVEDAVGREHGLDNTGMIVLESAAAGVGAGGVGAAGGWARGGWRVVSWAGQPIGGPLLDDGAGGGPAGEAADPTGSDPTGSDPADSDQANGDPVASRS